jgi:hypothetical protein
MKGMLRENVSASSRPLFGLPFLMWPFERIPIGNTIREDRVFCARFPYVTRSRTRQPATTPALQGRCKTTAPLPVRSRCSSGVAALTKRGLDAACCDGDSALDQRSYRGKRSRVRFIRRFDPVWETTHGH